MLKDIPAELYHDETISFIADRYHTTTQHIIASFLIQDGVHAKTDRQKPIVLEENEMEILRGLTNYIHLKRSELWTEEIF